MINIDFLVLKTGELIGFNICGHSNMAEFGKDIVCAAVSSAAYMTVNTISEIKKVDADIIIEEDGRMFFKIKNNNLMLCQDILLGFKLHMLNLEEQYPENIIVNYLEV